MILHHFSFFFYISLFIKHIFFPLNSQISLLFIFLSSHPTGREQVAACPPAFPHVDPPHAYTHRTEPGENKGHKQSTLTVIKTAERSAAPPSKTQLQNPEVQILHSYLHSDNIQLLKQIICTSTLTRPRSVDVLQYPDQMDKNSHLSQPCWGLVRGGGHKDNLPAV